jgi:uncharacterized protein YbjT (DUF2867 family)
MADLGVSPRRLFVTGGTGYLGGALLPALLARGHSIRALVRPGSERKLPPGCEAVAGNALDASTFTAQVAPADTFVHLVGVSHPAPWKADQFRAVDLASALATVAAARQAGVAHLVYLSVAQPAPVMRAYVAVRAECEAAISAAGLTATCVRPWYVLGPGHRWAYALVPFYAFFERLPATRATARRLGLVTLTQMIGALVRAVENPPATGSVRLLEVEAIRQTGSLPVGSA